MAISLITSQHTLQEWFLSQILLGGSIELTGCWPPGKEWVIDFIQICFLHVDYRIVEYKRSQKNRH